MAKLFFLKILIIFFRVNDEQNRFDMVRFSGVCVDVSQTKLHFKHQGRGRHARWQLEHVSIFTIETDFNEKIYDDHRWLNHQPSANDTSID